MRGRKFLLLRYEAETLGLTPNNYLAEQIGMSESALNDRYADRTKWRIDEIYKVMDLIKKPYEEIYKYFPPGGVGNVAGGETHG